MPSRSILALAALAAAAAPLAAQKPVITSSDQLPVHTYPVTEPASGMLQDSAAMDRLCSALERDLTHDLSHYHIEDQATRRDDYAALSDIAVLQGRYADALAYADSGRALESKPAARLFDGVMLRAFVAAAEAPPARAKETFSATLGRELDALPYDSVQEQLKSTTGNLALFTPTMVTGLVHGQYDPAAASGHISQDIAVALVQMAAGLRLASRYRDEAIAQLNRVIDAHHVEKADIWAARDVSLDGASGLTPVVVAINDVGTDVSLFPGRVWTNRQEIPGNGEDDDHDGYVDDVHGIGWSWNGTEVTGSLRPLAPFSAAEMKAAEAQMEGFHDLQAHLNTPAARALRSRMASLKAAEVKPLYERLEFYANYAHGTHVAGIAVRGNPAIRLQVDRMEFPYQIIPPAPTEQWADGFASVLRRTVAYYERTGVRVVNMSWGFSQDDLQQWLEANRVGKSDQERKAMAARYYNTVADTFRNAMAGAPGVLFVSAAGNSNNSNAFTRTVPASFDLPNSITVGAVDQAGDQAAFTSFGKVDVYADGYEVESVLPGGEHQKWSGTSMAAPQVVNLAAKLLAAHPRLSTADLRRLIIDGADTKVVGGRTIRLLNEKKSFALAGGE
ncbi:MAG: S8 family serine peptidase [Gemmatimonadetes bacterium]|nr:S8 family serine peptidase [Gemmatimonadota bacterium]